MVVHQGNPRTCLCYLWLWVFDGGVDSSYVGIDTTRRVEVAKAFSGVGAKLHVRFRLYM